MKNILFLAVAFIFLLAACNDDDESTTCTTSNSGIYGTWDWIQSTYYFTANGPEVQDPGTEGYTRSVEIKTNNVAIFYKNGLLEDSTNYSIIDDQISFNNGGTYYYSEDSCIFVLDLSYIDGPKEEYECACEAD
jgi:hypothetical protein